MKKIFRFTISILLALCITATGISPFVVIARQNTQQADLLLDDVLASPLVNLISYFSSNKVFISLLQKKCPAFTELLDHPAFLSVLHSRYQQLISISNPGIETLNKVLFLDLLIQSYDKNLSQKSFARSYFETIYTCRGTPVEAFVCTYPTSDAQWELHASDVSTYSLYVLDSPSWRYNCHSYAWYMQSTNNIYSIEEPGAFLEDRTYIQYDGGLNGVLTASVGDIIVYFSDEEPIHSGVITNVAGTTLADLTVISKWGTLGLYRHNASNCCYIQEDFGCNRVVIYKLCTHFDTNHSCQSSGSSTHTCICVLCGSLGTEQHIFDYASINSNSHNKNCTDCSFEQTVSHSFEYETINVASHLITCKDCDYTGVAPHTLNVWNKCTLCGGKGSQIEFNSLKEEGAVN